MFLSDQESYQFYTNFSDLLTYANDEFEILENLNQSDGIGGYPIIKVAELRDLLFDSPGMIDSFVKENPSGLSPRDLEIVSGWKNFVKGRFFIVRHLKNYSVFLDS